MVSKKLGSSFSEKRFACPPVPDTETGKTVFEPEDGGSGNWVGGPDTVYDPETNRFYMYHRVRKPIGEGRGSVARIGESKNGLDFEVIWKAKKDELNAESLEVGSLIKDPASGIWRLYISFQPKGTEGWQVALVEADSPGELELSEWRTVMLPEDYGLFSLKDPRIYHVGGQYYAYVCVDQEGKFRTIEKDGAEIRIPNGFDSTGLMTSPDGKHWKNFRYVLQSGSGQGTQPRDYKARLNSIVWLAPLFIGFYDGGETFYDNFEEKTGLATSTDLINWTKVPLSEPWIDSSHGTVRYLDALRRRDKIHYYYEYTRSDGSHEIRANVESLG